MLHPGPKVLSLVLAFAALTYLESPDGVLLLLLWLGSVTLIWRELGLLEPGGIVPALWLPFWQRQDEVARSLSSVVFAYATAFYFKASVALHFFMPAMVLPLAVFWRSDRSWMRPRLQRALVAAGIVAAAVLSWPRDHAVHTQTRTFRESIRVRTAGYSPLVPATYRRHNNFMEFVPLPSDQGIPRDRFGVSPLALNYCAHRFTADSTRVDGSRVIDLGAVLQEGLGLRICG